MFIVGMGQNIVFVADKGAIYDIVVESFLIIVEHPVCGISQEQRIGYGDPSGYQIAVTGGKRIVPDDTTVESAIAIADAEFPESEKFAILEISVVGLYGAMLLQIVDDCPSDLRTVDAARRKGSAHFLPDIVRDDTIVEYAHIASAAVLFGFLASRNITGKNTADNIRTHINGSAVISIVTNKSTVGHQAGEKSDSSTIPGSRCLIPEKLA